MSNFIPNRLTAGTAGAGRYTYKTNSESDLELEGESTPVNDVEGTPALTKAEVIKAHMKTLAQAQPDDVLAEVLDTLRAKENKSEAEYAALSVMNLESVTRSSGLAKTLPNESLMKNAAPISHEEYVKLKPSEVHVRDAAYDELVNREVIADGEEVPTLEGSASNVIAIAGRISSVDDWNDLSERISERLTLSEPEETVGNEFSLRESAAIISAMDARGLELIKNENFDDFSHDQITGIKQRKVDISEAKGAVEGTRRKLQEITWGSYDAISALDEKTKANPNSLLAGSWKHESDNLRYTAIAARTAIMDMGANEE